MNRRCTVNFVRVSDHIRFLVFVCANCSYCNQVPKTLPRFVAQRHWLSCTVPIPHSLCVTDTKLWSSAHWCDISHGVAGDKESRSVCIFNKFPRASGLVVSVSVGQFHSVVSGLFRVLNATRSLLSLSTYIPHNLLDITATSGCAVYSPSLLCIWFTSVSCWQLPEISPPSVYIHHGDGVYEVQMSWSPSLLPSASSTVASEGRPERSVPLWRSVFPQ